MSRQERDLPSFETRSPSAPPWMWLAMFILLLGNMFFGFQYFNQTPASNEKTLSAIRHSNITLSN